MELSLRLRGEFCSQAIEPDDGQEQELRVLAQGTAEAASYDARPFRIA
jgi:hypothetical protein